MHQIQLTNLYQFNIIIQYNQSINNN